MRDFSKKVWMFSEKSGMFSGKVRIFSGKNEDVFQEKWGCSRRSEDLSNVPFIVSFLDHFSI